MFIWVFKNITTVTHNPDKTFHFSFFSPRCAAHSPIQSIAGSTTTLTTLFTEIQQLSLQAHLKNVTYFAFNFLLSWLNTCKWVNPLSVLSVVFNNDGPSWISVYLHKYVTKFILSSFRILFRLWMHRPFEAWLWPFDVELQSHMLQSILQVLQMTDLLPSSSTGSLTITLDWLPKCTDYLWVQFDFVESFPVDFVWAWGGEQFLEHYVQKPTCNSKSNEYNYQVSEISASVFDFLCSWWFGASTLISGDWLPPTVSVFMAAFISGGTIKGKAPWSRYLSEAAQHRRGLLVSPLEGQSW